MKRGYRLIVIFVLAILTSLTLWRVLYCYRVKSLSKTFPLLYKVHHREDNDTPNKIFKDSPSEESNNVLSKIDFDKSWSPLGLRGLGVIPKKPTNETNASRDVVK